MAGMSDYAAQAVLDWTTGQLAMPAKPAVFMALFTVAPTSDAGTGGTEVTGGSYARIQVAGNLTTNGTTAAGVAILNFASVPAWITVGMSVRDVTTTTVIPAATTILSKTGTTVTMSANATGAGVGATDVICFSSFTPSIASTGAMPNVVPSKTLNTNTIITFPQATADWTTITSWGLYDAVTAGNFIQWDFMGNFAWLPFTGTSASPSVLTSTAHGYSNSDSVVVSSEYGGVLPATAGSWAGIKTVAGVTTDTFTAGVNTTGTGDGMVRKIVQQPIPINVTASFATSQMTLTAA